MSISRNSPLQPKTDPSPSPYPLDACPEGSLNKRVQLASISPDRANSERITIAAQAAMNRPTEAKIPNPLGYALCKENLDTHDRIYSENTALHRIRIWDAEQALETAPLPAFLEKSKSFESLRGPSLFELSRLHHQQAIKECNDRVRIGFDALYDPLLASHEQFILAHTCLTPLFAEATGTKELESIRQQERQTLNPKTEKRLAEQEKLITRSFANGLYPLWESTLHAHWCKEKGADPHTTPKELKIRNAIITVWTRTIPSQSRKPEGRYFEIGQDEGVFIDKQGQAFHYLRGVVEHWPASSLQLK